VHQTVHEVLPRVQHQHRHAEPRRHHQERLRRRRRRAAAGGGTVRLQLRRQGTPESVRRSFGEERAVGVSVRVYRP
jgi:hypothetical protein